MATTIRLLVNRARGSRRRGPGTCKDCGQALWWCASESKKPIPFDENPDVIALAGDIEVVALTHVHWWTCPKRGRVQPPPPEAPPERTFSY